MAARRALEKSRLPIRRAHALVSHELKCIFVHIPKVAGTSIKSLFEGHSASESEHDPMPFKPNDSKFDPPPPHLRATDHLKFGHVTASQFDTYFKFAFVRNPWDRIVSEYVYRRYPSRFDFKTFLFERLPRPAWSDEYCHIIPQYDFVHDEAGHLVVDFVGRFESIAADFSAVKERLGLTRLSMPHRNRSSDSMTIYGPADFVRQVGYMISRRRRRNTYSNYRDYYDSESRAFVAELYEKDIRAFKYSFE
ncbi:MAG: sulfotransferase family protein [Thiocapsa sp.]|nr:sulfotransferase family protein [Thiocapsa sp.]